MSLLYAHTNISSVLLHEFECRKKRNHKYSLRAFARDLKMSPSQLSEVIKGTHGLSESSATMIAKHLKFRDVEKKYWLDLVLTSSARSSKVRELAKNRADQLRKTNTLREIQESEFRVISDWYHAAILELPQLPGFNPDPTWISSQLGITPSQAVDAIERLQNLHLLKIEKEGQWKVHPEAYEAFSDLPSTAIRKFLRQNLQNGIDSLLADPIEDRELQSMIFALPKSKLPEFRQTIKAFLHKFWQDIEKDKKDSLYALSVQLVPVKNRKKHSPE